MNRISTDYVSGIHAFNYFTDMLYSALKEGMPGCLLSTTAAYWWKGYRIDNYNNLVNNNFHCQVYTNDLDTLIFQESYFDGRYQYPWEGNPKLQLSRINFFDMEIDEQKNKLKEFIESASERALIWQTSDERKNRVPDEFIQGKVTRRIPRKEGLTYGRVTKEYLKAIILQNQLFDMLTSTVNERVEKLLSRNVLLFPNKSVYNWDFRGYRMKVLTEDNQKPIGPSPYLWRIYYKNPNVITFESYDGRYSEILDRIFLDEQFFALGATEQLDFLQKNVSKIVEEYNAPDIERFTT